MTLSYDKGSSSAPLLDQTIGENLRRTAERFPDREALVVPHQGYRATYAELWARSTGRRARFIARGVRKGDRVGIWAPQPPRVGRHPVRHRADRRDPRHDQPCLQGGRAGYALDKAGVSLLVMAAASRPDYCDARRLARARRDRARATTGRRSWPTATGSATRELAEREASLRPTTRSTSSSPRARPARRRARRSPTATSSTTPTSRGARWATRSATACACRCRSTTASGW